MLLVLAVKILVLSGCILSTGILFSCYNLVVWRNFEEVENLFNITLIGTFIFISFVVGFVIYAM
jgi:hypothetical protein